MAEQAQAMTKEVKVEKEHLWLSHIAEKKNKRRRRTK